MWLNPGYQERIRRAITRLVFLDVIQGSIQGSAPLRHHGRRRRTGCDIAPRPRTLAGWASRRPYRQRDPLYGVLHWQWDTFQLLMLYWMETAVIAFWTLMRLAGLDAADRGEITVNGRPRRATRFALVGFFSLHAGAFIIVHLLFLWLFFSSEWKSRC